MSYLKQYEYVLAIAARGSFSQAAEDMGTTQPVLSRYIQKLEAELGIMLFDRSTSPIILTEAGKCFAEVGRQMIDADRQLMKQLQELKNVNDITVRIGISPSRTAHLLPEILKEFKTCSSASVVLEEHGTNDLNSMLIKGDLDFIFSHLDETTTDFTRVVLFEDSVLLAVASGYPERSVLDQLKSSTIVSLTKGTRTGDMLSQLLDSQDIHSPSLHCTTIESALSMVKAGLGITIVPSYIAKFGHDDGLRFEPIPDEMAESLKPSKFCLFYRKNQFLTQAEAAFIDCARRVVSRRVER